MHKADGEQLHGFFRALVGAYQSVARVEETIHRACGLTGAQQKNLGHLLRGGSMTLSDLAFDRGVSRQSVQVAMGGLVELGYVRFVDNPRHRKARLIEVTALGLERHLAAAAAEEALIERLFPDLDADEVASAAALLRRLGARLDALSPEEVAKKADGA